MSNSPTPTLIFTHAHCPHGLWHTQQRIDRRMPSKRCWREITTGLQQASPLGSLHCSALHGESESTTTKDTSRTPRAFPISPRWMPISRRECSQSPPHGQAFHSRSSARDTPSSLAAVGNGRQTGTGRWTTDDDQVSRGLACARAAYICADTPPRVETHANLAHRNGSASKLIFVPGQSWVALALSEAV